MVPEAKAPELAIPSMCWLDICMRSADFIWRITSVDASDNFFGGEELERLVRYDFVALRSLLEGDVKSGSGGILLKHLGII